VDAPPPRSRWTDVAAGEDVARRYAERFAAAAASGKDVHGEAHFVHALLPGPSRVLDAGCGTGRVAIRLAELGHEVVGVDLDLAGPGFDLVVMAGNVMPLVAAGSEPAVLAALARHLRPEGLLVAGFGLDVAHLPLDEVPFGLPEYDAWCSAAGLVLQDRYADWDANPFDGGGYAVSTHRR
jgi:SAM-dependent methyltransferase